jgi:hypothetical protein
VNRAAQVPHRQQSDSARLLEISGTFGNKLRTGRLRVNFDGGRPPAPRSLTIRDRPVDEWTVADGSCSQIPTGLAPVAFRRSGPGAELGRLARSAYVPAAVRMRQNRKVPELALSSKANGKR